MSISTFKVVLAGATFAMLGEVIWQMPKDNANLLAAAYALVAAVALFVSLVPEGGGSDGTSRYLLRLTGTLSTGLAALNWWIAAGGFSQCGIPPAFIPFVFMIAIAGLLTVLVYPLRGPLARLRRKAERGPSSKMEC